MWVPALGRASHESTSFSSISIQTKQHLLMAKEESERPKGFRDPYQLCWCSGSCSALRIFCSKREAKMDRERVMREQVSGRPCSLPSLGTVADATGSGE